MSKLYDPKRIEAWISLYFISRATGKTASELLGISYCTDCWQRPELWHLRSGRWGEFYECSVCNRFIGYPPRKKS